MSLVNVAVEVNNRIDAERKRSLYKYDPVAWIKEVAGFHVWSSQEEIARSIQDNQNVAVKAGHGTGKALTLDTPLPTPHGWTTMRDVQPGDYLLDEKSNPTQVVAVSDEWMEDTYRVHFDDGTHVEAAGQHEWSVLDLSRRTAKMKRGVSDWRDFWGSAVIRETVDLYESQRTTSGQHRWRIPAPPPIKGRSRKLPVDPYVLGAWLGDGTTGSAQITTHPDDYQILTRFEKAGYTVRKLSSTYLWSFADKGLFVTKLRDLGIYDSKAIPREYFRCSESQRIDLIRGILDTDGTVDRRGVVSIDLMNEGLARGVVELVRSLGGRATLKPRRATLNGRDVGVRWRMTLKTPFNPFFLKRKAERWSETRSKSQGSRVTQRTIVRVEKIETKPTKCVQVDSPSHLFLAGEGLVPTHNSLLIALLICWWVDTRYPDCFVASTAPSQAQIGAIVWREVERIRAIIAKRHRDGIIDHQLPGYITRGQYPEWKNEFGTPIGFGRKPPDQKIDDAFQGIHAVDGVLAVGDEAVGLTEEMIDALGNITSTKNSRRVLICNPTNPASHIAKLFKNKPKNWTFHTISVLNSPNFTDERYVTPPEVLEALSDESFVESKREEYGEGSPRWMSRIEGEFAWDQGDTLFKSEDLAKAYDAELPPSDDLPRLGVDVARSKDGDTNTIYEYRGGELKFVDEWNEANAMNTARKVHQTAMERGVSEVRIDGTGMGGPIADAIFEMSEGKYEVIEILGSDPSPDKHRWYNFRAWSFWLFQDRMSKGEIHIDVGDSQLADELLGMEKKERVAGHNSLLLESKKDMRKRGVSSPNRADAANYAQVDLTWVEGNENAPKPGDRVIIDPYETEYAPVDTYGLIGGAF